MAFSMVSQLLGSHTHNVPLLSLYTFFFRLSWSQTANTAQIGHTIWLLKREGRQKGLWQKIYTSVYEVYFVPVWQTQI